jgi:hypothetical protein
MVGQLQKWHEQKEIILIRAEKARIIKSKAY